MLTNKEFINVIKNKKVYIRFCNNMLNVFFFFLCYYNEEKKLIQGCHLFARPQIFLYLFCITTENYFKHN